MEHLDPLALLNLISTCRSAFATFHRYPRRFLHASIESLGLPLSGTAMAILEARRHKPSYKTWMRDPDQKPVLFYGEPKTEVDAFVEIYVKSAFHGDSNLPEDLQDPLDALRTVAAIHDAVDTLSGSLIWKYVKAATSKEDPQASENDEIRQALWVYHLYCVLFRPPPGHDSEDENDDFIIAQENFFDQILEVKGSGFVE